MEFNIDRYEKYSILTIESEKVDSMEAPELKSAFLTLAQEEAPSVIVNMGKVKYIDSSGLSALLVGNRTFSEQGAFIIFDLTEHVEKLIKISQLDKVLNIAPSQKEAADMLLMTEIQKGSTPTD